VHADPETGPYFQVFDKVTDRPLSLSELGHAAPMFSPLLVGINPPVREGRWRIIGRAQVGKFEYPTYLYGMPDRDNIVHMWYLKRRNKYTEIGPSIPDKYRHLERSSAINAEILEKKICKYLESKLERPKATDV
jgi:hypothetical protein